MKRRKTQTEQGKMPRNKLGKGNSQEFWKLHKTWHPKSVPSQCSQLHVIFSKEKLWFPRKKPAFFQGKTLFSRKNAIFQGELFFQGKTAFFFMVKPCFPRKKSGFFSKEKLCFLKEIWGQTTQPGYQGWLKLWEKKNPREKYSWCSSRPIDPSFGWSTEVKKSRARNRSWKSEI